MKYFVSVSGGESSGFMVDWMEKNRKPEDEILYAFANTSKEMEETLVFANALDQHYGLGLVWIESMFSNQYRGRTQYRITDFENAKRQGEVFESMIVDYGIPNKAYPHCTRELKTYPLQKLARDILGKDFFTVIGIRVDEIDRVNKNHEAMKYMYPLVKNGINKAMINKFWRYEMPFRLNLKGYQGNCGKCWKKSLRKLLTIESEERAAGIRDDWWLRMEQRYGNYVPPHRADKRKGEGTDITFYRENLSAHDIMELSKKDFVMASDDSQVYDYQQKLFGFDLDIATGQCSESCEPF